MDENNKKVSFKVNFDADYADCGHMLFCDHKNMPWDEASSYLSSDDLFLDNECLRDLVLLLHANDNYVKNVYDRLTICNRLNSNIDITKLHEMDALEMINTIKSELSESRSNGHCVSYLTRACIFIKLSKMCFNFKFNILKQQ